MESELENDLSRQNYLSHETKLNQAYFINISQTQLRYFLVNDS